MYRYAIYRPPSPARVSISTMTVEGVELYWHVPLPGQPVPVEVQPFMLEYSIPKEEEIAWAVCRLRLNLSGNPSGMRAEDLRQWLISADWDNKPDATKWKIFSIIKTAFWDGTLAKDFMWKTVVLIPKGGSSDFGRIGLAEVLWKTMTSLLNLRLAAAITFHDVMHRFRSGRGTGTVALKAKVLQQFMYMMEEVLFEFFLDLQKAYDALDKDRCLGILAAYRVGPRTIIIMRTYWGRLVMVSSTGGYFGFPFKVCCGITQCDPLPPIIFNVVVDAVICYWLVVVAPTKDDTEGLGP